MCGIHGLMMLSGGRMPDAVVLKRMANVTRHRGPDDEGEYVGEGVMLGIRRLSVIDVAGGHQPIANEDETLRVVCNGEIYNFRQLREQLQRQGHRFRTESDSEVVLHLYEQYGDAFATHLDGMYAFALWDSVRRRLLIGRDRLGIKPLYYYNDGARLVFASEAKAILAVPFVRAEIDSAGLSEYLSLGYVPAPHSMFRGIDKLPPASLLVCENGHCEVRTYWRLPAETDERPTENEWADLLRSQLEQAVVSQMVSDVPLGAFLSGGIDSSAVVAFMAKHSDRPVRTYSIGFDRASGGGYYNELPYARRVAKLFNTDHREIIVKPDVAELLPDLLWHLDEPMADAAFLTTYLVSKFARQDVTVILSGVGGDELFGGYRRYLGEHYAQHYNRIPRWIRQKALAPIVRSFPSDRHSPLLNLSRHVRSFVLANDLPFEQRYRSYVQVFDATQRAGLLEHRVGGHDALDRAFAATERKDPLGRLFEVDLATQLPNDLLMLTDKTSMAASLECRVPLLDQRLVELSARMPSRYKIRGRTLKHVLKKALYGLLPEDILHRKKRGFGAPIGAWLKGELSPLLESVLSRESIERRGVFHWPAVEQAVALHVANKADHTDHLMALMNFELWCRLYLDGQVPQELTDELKAA